MPNFDLLRHLALLLGCVGIFATGYAQNPVAPPAPRAAYEFSEATVHLYPPRVIRAGDSAEVFVELDSALWAIVELPVQLDDSTYLVRLDRGQGSFLTASEVWHAPVTARVQEYEVTLEVPVVDFPLWLSLVPPLLAILLALLFREVIVALFSGIAIGAIILAVTGGAGWSGLGTGLLRALDTYVIGALADEDHLAVLVFSLLIGGMVAIISKNGGMKGVVHRVAKLAKTAKSGQMATYLMGMLVFFDDYANTLVVGNTMRSITDQLRISREKLSYLVDSTAAPVAALAFVTTWIGAELGYIGNGVADLPHFPEDQSAYSIFIQSLGYSFYPILTLLFIPMLILSGRDFGPMLTAERRARRTGAVKRQYRQEANKGEGADPEFTPLPHLAPKARYAVLPVLVLVGGVLWGLFASGYDPEIWANPALSTIQRLSQTIGNANSYHALLWASLAGVLTAITMTLIGRRMVLLPIMESLTSGFKTMMGAMIILTLAWALNQITKDMYTAGYLTDLLGRDLPPGWIPAITFILGALVAFSTGSSWGTMAILFPLMIPLVWEASRSYGLSPTESLPLLYNVVASVLAGSVLGDHVSPISDTTILSSLASDCNHIDHVRTQLPYALVVGVIATFFGVLPAGLGVPNWLCFLISIGLLALVVRRVGRKVEAA